jgi:acetyl-CoA carboxylase biotin carboxyl carrier protein
MAEQENDSLDVRTIHQLVKMMKRYDLTAIDVNEGATRIRLRRRGPEPAFTPAAAPPAASGATAPPAAAPPPPTSVVPPPSTDLVIESPMVGTYYASSSPDSPPFVSVGSSVRSDTTVCVIEAMKVFTDIPAGIPAGMSGTITEVLVKNGQPVEFGQPLFRVRPA